jgi:hypothetical protein
LKKITIVKRKTTKKIVNNNVKPWAKQVHPLRRPSNDDGRRGRRRRRPKPNPGH